MAKRLAIKLVKSSIGYRAKAKDSLKALGLRKILQTVEHDDTPVIRGMINVVSHLVEVNEIKGAKK